MKKYIILITIVAIGGLLGVPHRSLAFTEPDENISAISVVTPSSTEPATTTSYAITLNLTSTDIDNLHIFIVTYPDGLPPDSTFGWDDVTLGPLIGLSGTGQPFEQDGSAVGYSITVDAASTSVSLGLSNIVNGTDGCYYVAMTTTNPPTTESSYTTSEPFEIGSGDCATAGDTTGEIEDISAVVFGTNAAIRWSAYPDADGASGQSYVVRYAGDAADLAEGGTPLGDCVAGEVTTCILSDLDTATTYVVDVELNDADGNRIAVSDQIELTTDKKKLTAQQFKTPKIKKNKTKLTFVVNYSNWKNSLVDDEVEYVEKIYLSVGSKNNITKKFALDPTTTKKKIKKKFTQKRASQHKPIYVRLWAKYVTDEKTKKSSAVKVKLY